jgi:hypothetical protein
VAISEKKRRSRTTTFRMIASEAGGSCHGLMPDGSRLGRLILQGEERAMAGQPTMKLIDPKTGLAQCTVCGARHYIRFRRGYKVDAWSWYCLKRDSHPGRRGPKLPITSVKKPALT